MDASARCIRATDAMRRQIAHMVARNLFTAKSDQSKPRRNRQATPHRFETNGSSAEASPGPQRQNSGQKAMTGIDTLPPCGKGRSLSIPHQKTEQFPEIRSDRNRKSGNRPDKGASPPPPLAAPPRIPNARKRILRMHLGFSKKKKAAQDCPLWGQP